MKNSWLPIIIALLAGPPAAPAAEGNVPKGGSLETALSLLVETGPRAERDKRIYAAAYPILLADPKATYADLAADPAFVKLCRDNGVVHLGGPMLGDVSAHGAKVWLRTLGPADVEVRLAIDGREKTFGPVRSGPATDMTAVVPVTGLRPATRYPYRVFIDGKPIAIPDHAAITTAPPDQNARVRIAFGTCPHRWGLNHRKQADLIRAHRPAALLLYGDIAVQDRRNHLGAHRVDYLLRDFQGPWRDLVAAVPVYATWDDHDYYDNDRWGIPKGCTDADRRGIRRVFRDAWVNPFYGFGDQGGGIFLRTRIGPCDIIMVDNRYFRTGQPGSFLGDAQMKWLQEQLLDCQGPFIILSCGTMWSDYVSNGKDSWGRWDPDGRERLFRFIEKHRIPGVLLISGDRHGARGFTIPRPGGFQFYEFEPASLGGRHGPPVRKDEWNTQLFGFAGIYAFGQFDIDATVADPTVTFQLVDVEQDKPLYQITLKRSQLTPPAPTE